MTNPPENWQAVARALCEDVTDLITPLALLQHLLHRCILENDYALFQEVLHQMERITQDDKTKE